MKISKREKNTVEISKDGKDYRFVCVPEEGDEAPVLAGVFKGERRVAPGEVPQSMYDLAKANLQ